MSGARDLDFQAVSDLILEVNFQIKCSTLLNRIRKREEDNESNLKIKEECDFFEHSNQFDKELVEDLFKPPEHKKLELSYVEPQVQDAETTEIETKDEDDEFFDLEQKFNAIDNAATEKKKQNDLIDLVDDMLDENNTFNNKIKTEGTYIEGNLFDDINSKDIKKVSDGVIKETNFDDKIEIPFDDEVALDGPKENYSQPKSMRLASNRIIKIYLKQIRKESLKITNKKSVEWLKKAGFLGTDNLQTTDNNNDVTLDDLETIDFNIDTQMTDLINIDKIDLKKTSARQQVAKKIIKKYGNLKRKGEPINYSGLNKKSKSRKNEILFIKQIPMHPRN